MSTTALILAVALSSQYADDGRAEGNRRGWRERCAPDVAASFTDVERALADLDKNIADVDSKREQKRLADEAGRVRRAIERARDVACEASTRPPTVVVQRPQPAPPPPPPPAPPPPREPVVMSDAGFQELKAAIARENFDDHKRNVLELGVQGETCVTVEQAKQLMGLGSFSDWKIAVARHTIPRLVDRERAFTLPQALTFPGDKDAVTKMLTAHPQLDICKRPAR